MLLNKSNIFCKLNINKCPEIFKLNGSGLPTKDETFQARSGGLGLGGARLARRNFFVHPPKKTGFKKKSIFINLKVDY